MVYLDIGIKFELFLFDLNSNVFWISLLDIGVFIFSVMVFFADVSALS